MTTREERTAAVLHARLLLRELLVPSKTRNVSADLRRRAKLVLEHFPRASDLAPYEGTSNKYITTPAEKLFHGPTAHKFAALHE